MRERGILFSGPMVRKLLTRQKHQTRRLVKPTAYMKRQPRNPLELPGSWHRAGDGTWVYLQPGATTDIERAESDAFVLRRYPAGGIRCPYGQPGDRLWVRETSRDLLTTRTDGTPVVVYAADFQGHEFNRPPKQRNVTQNPWKWTPAILMPRKRCRITLDVTRIRVERAQDISDDDIIAEGVTADAVRELWVAATKKDRRAAGMHPERPVLLNTTNVGEDREWGLVLLSRRELWRLAWTLINGPDSWDANPWVWAIDFRRLA